MFIALRFGCLVMSSRAEDITSDTFVRAWARSDSIRTETLKAYLFTIARNAYLGRLRKGKRQVDLVDIYPDPAPGPEAIVESQLKLLEIRRLLITLPEIDRAAFILRVQHELPYSEIARILELSLSAAKVKVHRVRKKLLMANIDNATVDTATLDKELDEGMKITRDVILDLLPLYLASEVSEDSRLIVENYLESDLELAKIAEKLSDLELSSEVPVPLNEEDEMAAYKEAKKLMFWRIIIVATIMSLVLLAFVSFGVVAMLFLTSS